MKMRTSLLISVAALLSVTAAACGDVDGESGLGGRRTLKRTAPTDDTGGPADESSEHDPNQSTGETSQDPGNPNANTTPTAPTNPGTNSADFAVQLASATPTVDLGQSTSLDVTCAAPNSPRACYGPAFFPRRCKNRPVQIG